MRAPPGRVFVLTLRAPPELDDPIRELRWILKRLLRQYRFQCVDARELRKNDDYNPLDDIRKSVAVGFGEIRKRKASGGPGWEPK